MHMRRSPPPATPGALRLDPRKVEISGHASIVIGPTSNDGREIHLANPGDRWDHGTERYLFALGGFSIGRAVYVLAWGDLEEALTAAGEYALDRWPGLSASGEVERRYHEILRERGLDDGDLSEIARWELLEEAEIDTIQIGDDYRMRMHSEDVHILAELPTRRDLEDLAYPGGPDAWRGEVQARHPVYRPTRRDWDPGYHARIERADWELARAGVRMARRAGAISLDGCRRIDAAICGERFTIGAATF